MNRETTINNSINNVFGTNFKLSSLGKPKELPVYLYLERNFYLLTDKDVKIVLVEISENEDFGVIAYEKQLFKYNEYFKKPVSLYFNHISKTQRNSLIKRRISFISAEQIYLPYLGMYLQKRFINNLHISNVKMMPITQSLYIYLFYILKGKKTNKKDAAKYLSVTSTSLTRSSNQLLQMGLIEQEKCGKEYYIYSKEKGYKAFINAKRFLINPVKDSLYIESNKKDNLLLAGESALSKYTMLNNPKIKCVAIFKDNKYKSKTVDVKWSINKDVIKVEFWKYNPNLFAKNGIVDPVSLYMSFQNNNDERIDNELENMMKDNKW